MKIKIILAMIVFGLLVGCSEEHHSAWSAPEDQEVIDEKAQIAFLQLPMVKEFAAEGISVNCEKSICAKITNKSFDIFTEYKSNFVEYRGRIKKITFIEIDYPIYRYNSEHVLIPFQQSKETLDEFFEVLRSIQNFENQVKFRVEFPNNYYIKKSVDPLLEILKTNSGKLKAEAHRYDLVEVNSEYNRFFPGKKTLMLKIDNLKKSFLQQWAFMSIFFKAQDFFGNINFQFAIEDEASALTMNLLFGSSSDFASLFFHLQDRTISFFDFELNGYFDMQSNILRYMDLGVNNALDKKYLLEVFQDQIRLVQISDFVGKKIYHTDAFIDLEGHSECLDKVESIKNSLKKKIDAIDVIQITSDSQESSFSAGYLFLACKQDASEMEKVLEGIK